MPGRARAGRVRGCGEQEGEGAVHSGHRWTPNMETSARNREKLTMCLSNERMELRGKFWAGPTNVAVTRSWEVFQTMGEDEITSGRECRERTEGTSSSHPLSPHEELLI